RSLRFLLAAASFLLLAAAPASAQEGAISGRLTDSETGAPLTGARVEAVAGTRAVATAVSGQDGSYRLANLPPGSCTVVVTLVGAQLVASAFQLIPVLISAPRRQEKALDAPASVSVVDSPAVAERSVVTPVDHLRSSPGVDVVTQGVQSTNVVLRGFNNI